MALKLRTIQTETGKELENCDGTPGANLSVTFQLVTEGGGQTMVVDSTDGYNVLSKTITALTDANGALSVSLWPTTRGDKLCYYNVNVQNGISFRAPLPDGETSLTWAAFVGGRLDI